MTREEVVKTCHTLKDRFRSFKPGGCKILSKGDNCDCSLCLVDNLMSYIFELEEKIKGENHG